MIVKLIIPVVDTDHINCDTDINMTREEYGDMAYNTYKRNDKAIDAYTRGIRPRSEYNNPYITETEYNRGYRKYDDLVFQDVECEAQIMDVKKQEISDEWLKEYVYNGKMLLLIVNINPSDIDPNVESELRFWMDDSGRLLNDTTLDDTTKLKYLPTRSFKIVTDEGEYKIENCKLVENRSDDNFPYCFVIIIEKIS